jgi:hypothetical protein
VEDWFGANTIFIIHLRNGSMLSRDIRDVSVIPDEEEVLLNAGFLFKIGEIIESDPAKQEEKFHLEFFESKRV